MITASADDEIGVPSKSLLRVVTRLITTIAGLSLMAKGLGFLRDAAAASKFGTGDAMDAYVLALSIPTLVAGLSGDAIPTALIPAYAKAKRSQGKKAAVQVVANGIYQQAGLILSICLILAVFSGPLVAMLAGDFNSSKMVLSQELFLTFLVFAVLFATGQAVTAGLQAEKKFTLAAVSPCLVPAVAIAMLFGFGASMGVFSLAVGLVAGSALHLGVLLYGAVRNYGWGCLKPNFRQQAAGKFFGDSMLLLLGGAIFGGCVMIDISVASRLDAGTVATYGYADKVLGIILSLAGIALGQALLPYLSDLHAAADRKGLQKMGKQLTLMVAAVTLPLVILFWLASGLITQVLFERGAFGPDETIRVAEALRWGSLQFPAAAMGIIASRMVIATGAVKYMCVVSAICLVANLILDLTLAPLFGLPGILVATAIVHTLSTVLLFRKISQS